MYCIKYSILREEAWAVYYAVIKHDGHLTTRGKCTKCEPPASVFYISRVFSNVRSVLFAQASSFALRGFLWYRLYSCKTIKHAISMFYLSSKPQVSMVYRLINHAGCSENARQIRKSWNAGDSSSVLPTSRVVYQLINHRNWWSIAL